MLSLRERRLMLSLRKMLVPPVTGSDGFTMHGWRASCGRFQPDGWGLSAARNGPTRKSLVTAIECSVTIEN
jgi:hypothetical protein